MVKKTLLKVKRLVLEKLIGAFAFPDTTERRINLSSLLPVYGIKLKTRIEVVCTEDDEIFLIVYQAGRDEPDYTIKLKGTVR